MKIKNTNMANFFAIPDAISLLNLSCGFISILLAINHYFSLSAIFIIFAIVFDSIDGWVARKLGRKDDYGFGKNIDSLSDVVSFGVAPGILLYLIGSNGSYSIEITYITAAVALMMVICGVLRLTRYNVIADHLDFNGFIGLPIPATAVLLATFVLSGFLNISPISIYVLSALMIVSSILMISNVKYLKFNNLKVIGIGIVLIILILIPIPIVALGLNIPATILFALCMIFAMKLFR